MEKRSCLIQTETELKTLVEQARKTDAVALDTEFFWERTYYPILGLIQIALSDEDCYLIDPLAVIDLQPLGNLLADRAVVKIFHDAPQDLTILQRATGCIAQNIFDTRLAAGFAGLSSTLSLSHLVKELLDIELSKDETRTDWLQRPLTDNQVRYALDDVRYLRAVRILLLTRIIGPKIRSWLQEELNLLNNPANYSGYDNGERYRKIRGSNKLGQQGLAILKNLAIWREGMAKKINRPRGHVVKDALLLEIATKKPAGLEQLREQTSISTKAATRYGEPLAAVVQTTLSKKGSSYPELRKPVRLDSKDRGSLEKLTGLISLKCEILGIAPPLLGNSSELKHLVKTLRGGENLKFGQLRQTEGWRKDFLVDFFRQNP